MVLHVRRVSSMEDSTDQIRSLEVEPFENQVGGNTPFFSLPNGHLLKPCSERELSFYRNMPHELIPLTPRCCSTVEGSITSCLPGCCSFCAREVEENLIICSRLRPFPTPLIKRKVTKNFLVLSDLTKHFEQPCVLDLKLGIRQHGDSAPPEKVAVQSEKCLATTSASLGIRLCGMRYYAQSGEPILLDKYEGRRMNEDQLRGILTDFFRLSGASHEVLTFVQKIKNALSTLNGVRLFGSSLLIVVEGRKNSSKAEVRLVDFANATLPCFVADNNYDGPDDGSLKGLATLEQILSSL